MAFSMTVGLIIMSFMYIGFAVWIYHDGRKTGHKEGFAEGRDSMWLKISETITRRNLLSIPFEKHGMKFEKHYRIIEAKTPPETVGQPFTLKVADEPKDGLLLVSFVDEKYRHVLSYTVQADLMPKSLHGKTLPIKVSGEILS